MFLSILYLQGTQQGIFQGKRFVEYLEMFFNLAECLDCFFDKSERFKGNFDQIFIQFDKGLVRSPNLLGYV